MPLSNERRTSGDQHINQSGSAQPDGSETSRRTDVRISVTQGKFGGKDPKANVIDKVIEKVFGS
jgi:hypothetical protein